MLSTETAKFVLLSAEVEMLSKKIKTALAESTADPKKCFKKDFNRSLSELKNKLTLYVGICIEDDLAEFRRKTKS